MKKDICLVVPLCVVKILILFDITPTTVLGRGKGMGAVRLGVSAKEVSSMRGV